MKKWVVSDIRWANKTDMELPFNKKWNKENPLPRFFWQRIWEYPYAFLRIPQNDTCIDVGGTYPFVLFKNLPNAVSVDIRDLNELDSKYHKGKWPKEKLIISDASNIPVEDNSYNYSVSISAIEEMPDTLAVLKEMIRITKHRVVVTMDISDEIGIPTERLREIADFLGVEIPLIPSDVLRSTSSILRKYNKGRFYIYNSIRTIGFTLDSIDEPKSVAILIPHWESYDFLKICLNKIKQFHNPKLKEEVYVLDDLSKDGSFEKAKEDYKQEKNIHFVQLNRYNKKTEPDVGLLLDLGLKDIKEQYVAAIDADFFPLSHNWLTFPISIIENKHCSSVGLDTGLSTAYKDKVLPNNFSQPKNGYIPRSGIYDNDWFTCTNNLYRVTTSALAKVVSEQIGFSRSSKFINQNKIFNFIHRAYHKLKRNAKFSKLFEKISGYTSILEKIVNSRYPYMPGGEDNGVAANHFIDLNYMGPKYNIPLTSYIGLTPKDGAFGQNIAGLAFHFALSTRALSKERREIEDAGKEFTYWVDRLHSEKIDEKLLEEMVSASKVFKNGGYHDEIPMSWYTNEYEFIQKEIKAMADGQGSMVN